MKRKTAVFIFFLAPVLCFAQIDFPIHATDAAARINPAIAGISESYLQGVRGVAFVNYRNQTSNMFNSSSLKIINAGVEQSFMDRNMTLNIDFFSGTLCNTALKDISARLSVAYHWTIRKDIFGNISHRLSFGLQAGYRNFAVNSDILTTTGMYDPRYAGGVDWSKSPLLYDDYSTTRHIFDMAAGIHYTGAITSLITGRIGVSMGHLTRPKTVFIEENTRTPILTVAQVDVTWQSAEYILTYNNRGRQVLNIPAGMISVSGEVLYSNQDKFNAIEAGMRFRYHFNNQHAIGFVLHGRYEDKNGEIIPGISFYLSGITIRVGYEMFLKHSETNMLFVCLRYNW
jgi:hypothetical protein